jgi:tetratricopeptide (TPR) repeat protein
MKWVGLALLFALFCLPRWAPAQTTTPAQPTPAMREQADQFLQQCETTDELGGFLPDQQESCYIQHLNAAVEAMKRRNWRGAIIEDTDTIILLVTYQQRLFVLNDRPGPINADTTAGPYVMRALAYQETKQYDLALADATAAVTFNPASPDAWNGRCWLHAITGDLADALHDCDKAQELAPKNPSILDSIGFVYLKMKSYPAAVENYEAALKISPKLASSLYGLGLAERAEGNQTQGSEYIAASETIDPRISSEFGT